MSIGLDTGNLKRRNGSLVNPVYACSDCSDLFLFLFSFFLDILSMILLRLLPSIMVYLKKLYDMLYFFLEALDESRETS